MKKWFALLLLVLLPLCAAADTYSLLPEDTELRLTEEKALAIATSMAEDYGIDWATQELRDTMILPVLSDQTQRPVWVVSFAVDHDPPPAFSVTLDAETGEVISTTQDNLVVLRKQWEEELQLYSAFWSLERQYVFSHIYETSTANASLPDEDDLTLAEADAIARAELARVYGVEDAQLAEYRQTVSFLRTLSTSWWIIGYHQEVSVHLADGGWQVNMDSHTGEVLLTLDAEAAMRN